jgi:hypothetical protein
MKFLQVPEIMIVLIILKLASGAANLSRYPQDKLLNSIDTPLFFPYLVFPISQGTPQRFPNDSPVDSKPESRSFNESTNINSRDAQIIRTKKYLSEDNLEICFKQLCSKILTSVFCSIHLFSGRSTGDHRDRHGCG